MKPLLLLVPAVAAVLVLITTTHAFPTPAGLYLSLSPSLISSTTSTLARSVSATANAHTSSPPVSGSGGGVSYTFSNIRYNVAMSPFSLASSGPPTLDLSTQIGMTITTDYHVRADDWPHPAESGQVLMFTPTPLPLSVTSKLLFDGPTLSFAASDVTLHADTDHEVFVFVHCSDSVCLIPVNDIAKAVAGKFVSTFQTELLKIINTEAAKIVDHIPTTFPLLGGDLQIALDGSFGFIDKTLVFQAQGAVDPKHNSSRPPFTPKVTPPSSALTSLAVDGIGLVGTEYLLDTAGFSAIASGLLSSGITITPSMVPADSPVKLNTSSPFFLSAVPGLASHPGRGMELSVVPVGLPTFNISAQNGLGLEPLALNASFSILSGSTSDDDSTIPAFTLSLTVQISAALNASLEDVASHVEIGAAATSLTFADVALASSSVGSVSVPEFAELLKLVAADAVKDIHTSVALPPVKDVKLLPPATLVTGAGYVSAGVGADWEPVDTFSESCPGEKTTGLCAKGNTCCSWGCCASTTGVCCGTAGVCCPAGFVCSGNAAEPCALPSGSSGGGSSSSSGSSSGGYSSSSSGSS